MTRSEDRPTGEDASSDGEAQTPRAATASETASSQPAGGGPGWSVPTPSARPGSPTVEYLRTTISRGGLVSLGWIACAVLAPALLSAICLVAALGAVSGGSLDFGSLVLGALVGIGTVLGSGLAAYTAFDAGFGGVNGSITVFALGTLVAVGAAVAVVARFRLRRDRVFAPSAIAELLRAGIEAGAIALVFTLLTGLVRLDGASLLGGVAATARPGSVFLVVLLVVGTTLFAARRAVALREQGSAGGAWLRLLRESGRFFAVQGAVFGVVALVALVIVAIDAESAAVFFVLLPFLGNAAVIAAALGHVGGVTASSAFFDSESVYAWDILGGHSAWLFALTALSLVFAAGVVGVKRTRTLGPDWRRVWQLPAFVFGVWFLLAVGIAGLRGGGQLTAVVDVSGGGSISLGWGVPFIMGVFAAVVSVAAEFVPLWVYRMNPSWLVLFGGRGAANAWLAGAAQDPVATASPAAEGETSPVSPGAAATVPFDGAPRVSNPSEPDDSTAPEGPAPDAAAASADPATADTAALGETAVLEQAPVAGPASGADAADIPAAAYAAPTGGVPPLPAHKPMSRKAKRALLATLISVGAVGVLIGAAAATVATINQNRDPAAPVEAYLSLLEEGDADRATELVDPGLPNDDRVLLTDDVLGAAEHRLEVVEVSTEYRGDEDATVVATMSLDGERFEHTFPVVAGPKEFLFLNTWELREPLLAEVVMSSDGTEALTVGKSEIPLEESSGFGETRSRSLYAYPGIYPVTGASDDYVTVSTEELRALPGVASAVSVTSEPSDALKELVLAQVQARITQCTEIPTNMDDVCPSITQDDDLAELMVVTQATDFEEIDLTRFTASEAEIAVRPNPTRYDRDPDLREVTFNARGSIEFVDGEPRVADLTLGW